MLSIETRAYLNRGLVCVNSMVVVRWTVDSDYLERLEAVDLMLDCGLPVRVRSGSGLEFD
jgi:hypothetical protein